MGGKGQISEVCERVEKKKTKEKLEKYGVIEKKKLFKK